MASDRDDEMARTATAPVSATTPAVSEPPIGSTLGRYRLERELGAGGMGVVHAAFDPDLERRVAVKVLRTGDSIDARQRLLREARAMAKLSHPNVVVVHEVGSAKGRDYVAMELIDGESLAEWMRAERRSETDILTVFVAAGRGLAAAHAAGIVHRDFKPHNVLKSRDGRILVTDFGLACGLDVDPARLALETTIQANPTRATSTSLSSLTMPGAVLGTPAYMAPEAWQGKFIGPPADQFGFCVALWEALTGERPFKGDTAEELRKVVDRGVSTLDLSKVPRRLRGPLTRGLDPDPARRYPTMEALLTAIAPKRRSRTPMVAGSIAVIAAAGVFVATRGSGDHELACPVPAITWPDQPASALVGAGHGELAAAIDRDLATWRDLRAQTCAAPENRVAKLECLDGVMARTDAIRRAAATMSGALESDVLVRSLVDPVVCTHTKLPRVRLTASPDVVTAFGMLADASRESTKLATPDLLAFADKSGIDGCARPIVLAAAIAALKETDKPLQRALSAQAITASDACNDDRVIADALIDDAPFHFELPVVGPAGQDALRKTQAAIERVEQADLVAELDLLRAWVASDHARWDDAFAASAKATASFGARGAHRRQLRAVLREIETHVARGNVDDFTAIRDAVAKWKPIAVADRANRVVSKLERYDAVSRFTLGDVAGAHAELVRLWKPKHVDSIPTIAIDGIVVDRAGRPVAGATVASNDALMVDSIAIVFPQNGDDEILLRTATTDAAGKFTMPDAPARGTIMAESGELRSHSAANAPHIRLVVEPTRRLAGKVDLGKLPTTKVRVVAQPFEVRADHVLHVAPVNTDGTFVLERAPTTRLQVGVMIMDEAKQTIEFQVVAASSSATSGLVLTPPSGTRSIDVITRSTISMPLDNAEVLLFPGKLAVTTITDLLDHTQQTGMQAEFAQRVVGENARKPALAKLQSGDLVAHFDNVRDGDLTICAIAMPSDLLDPAAMTTIRKHRNDLALKCEIAAPTDTVLVIDTPPQKRFD